MKILEAGGAWTKKLKCRGCKAVLEIESTDILYHLSDLDLSAQQYNEEIEGNYFVGCPSCGQNLTLNKKDIPNQIKEVIRKIK